MSSAFVSVNNPIFDVSQRYISTSNDIQSLAVVSKPPSSGRPGSIVALSSANSLNYVGNTPIVFSVPIGSNNRPLLSASTIRITGYMVQAAGTDLTGANAMLYGAFLPWNLAFACIQSYSLKLNNSNVNLIEVPDYATEYLTMNYLMTHSAESAESDPAILAPIHRPWDIYSIKSAVTATAGTGKTADGNLMSCYERTERVLGDRTLSSTKPVTLDIPISYLANLPDAVLNNASFLELRVGLRIYSDIIEHVNDHANSLAMFNISKVELNLVSPIVGVKQALENISAKASQDDNLAISYPRERKGVSFASGSDIIVPTIKHLQKAFLYQCARNVTTNVANCWYTSWGQFLPFIASGSAPLVRADLHGTNPISTCQLYFGNDLAYPQAPIRMVADAKFDPTELYYHYLMATNQLGTKLYSPIVNLGMMRTTMPFVCLTPFLLNSGAHLDTLAKDVIFRLINGATSNFQLLLELLRCFKISSSGDIVQIL